ncbi:MAG: hypothetical protein ACRDQ2_00240 [Gaiellales bacterium]
MAHWKTFAIRAARVFDGETLHKDFPLVVIDGSRIATLDSTTACPSGDLRVLDLGDRDYLAVALRDEYVADPERAPRLSLRDRPSHGPAAIAGSWGAKPTASWACRQPSLNASPGALT